MSLTPEFKKRLFEACKKVLTERMENAKYAMNEAQLAANGEEKSSAGDKYETSRAMGHRDRDMYARQLLEAKKEGEKLDKINLEVTDKIRSGSLIEVNNNFYFIATGLGKITLDENDIMVISKEAPISIALMNKKAGDEFKWNEKHWRIEKVV